MDEAHACVYRRFFAGASANREFLWWISNLVLQVRIWFCCYKWKTKLNIYWSSFCIRSCGITLQLQIDIFLRGRLCPHTVLAVVVIPQLERTFHFPQLCRRRRSLGFLANLIPGWMFWLLRLAWELIWKIHIEVY